MGMVTAALRQLARAPGTSLIAVLSLAVGVGCTAAAFAVADPIFLRPLPYAQPDALVSFMLVPDGNGTPGQLNLADVAALKTMPGLQTVAFQPRPGGRVPGHHREIRSMGVTDGFFEVLGVPIAQGRAFTAEEHRAESPVCLIAHDMAEGEFGSASPAIGQSFVTEAFQRRTCTIVGVLPDGFLFPDVRVPPAMMVPMSDSGQGVGNILGDVQIIARLEPGRGSAAVAGQLRQVVVSSEAAYPKLDRDRQAIVVPLREALFGHVSQSTLVIFVAVLSIALLACVNLYHLLAIQLRRRSRDFSVVTALGATRGRIVAELIVERLVIVVVGATVAMLVAMALRAYLLGELPVALAVLGASADPINLRVAVFVTLASLACVAMTAVHPVWQALRGTKGQDWLKERAPTGTRSARRADGMLIVSQSMATFLVLMISVTVVRGLVAMANQPLGFDYDSLRIMQPLPAPEYFADRAASRGERMHAAYVQMKSRFGDAIAASIGYPTGSTGGAVVAAAGNVEVSSYRVTGDFLHLAGLQLIAGEMFGESESLVRSEKAVVDEVAAQRLWPGSSPIGQVIEDAEDARAYQIVGVVRAIGSDLIESEKPEGAVFLPFEDRWARVPMFSYRSAGGVKVPDVTAIVESAMPGAFVTDEPLRPFRVQFARHEFLTALIGAIGLFDLLIVIVGVWSLIANQLHAERRDMSVRMALGATPGALLRMILTSRVLLPVSVGVAFGLWAYWFIAGRVAALTFKTPALDALTFTLSLLVVIAAAVLPMIGPSLRLANDRELLRELR